MNVVQVITEDKRSLLRLHLLPGSYTWDQWCPRCWSGPGPRAGQSPAQTEVSIPGLRGLSAGPTDEHGRRMGGGHLKPQLCSTLICAGGGGLPLSPGLGGGRREGRNDSVWRRGAISHSSRGRRAQFGQHDRDLLQRLCRVRVVLSRRGRCLDSWGQGGQGGPQRECWEGKPLTQRHRGHIAGICRRTIHRQSQEE